MSKTPDFGFYSESYVEKEYFSFILDHISPNNPSLKILDVGAASGDFIQFLTNRGFENVVGLEFDDALASKARSSGLNVITGDFMNADSELLSSFDIVTCSGVITIFDNLSKSINCLHNLVNGQGVLYLFGGFNPNPIDLIVKAYPCSKGGISSSQQPVSGFNMFSLNSTTQLLATHFNKVETKQFFPSLERPKPDMSFRSWTEKLSDGSLITLKDTQQFINFFGILAHV